MKNFIDRFVSLREEAGGGEGGGAGAGTVDVAALQQELADAKAAAAQTAKDLAAAKTTLGEKDEALQFWHKKATSGEPAKPAADAADDNVDLLDVLGTKGTKGLDEVLKKRGFVSQDDVKTLIAQTVEQVSREGKAVERFPELKDKDSEFFKETAKNVAALKRDGITGVAATELAAERTYLQFVDEGKIKPAVQRKAEAEKVDEEEEDRIARANAAGGATGRRSTRAADPAAGETAEDKALVSRICNVFEIDEKNYRKRAHETGVALGR